jgi:hypothetical protein
MTIILEFFVLFDIGQQLTDVTADIEPCTLLKVCAQCSTKRS